ncbi:formimidoylglutamase [Confluentibacter sediminis]|uniref:formimidoylglutamase n=1 Tax=Confluentibacter sediminis TaxID=2219045 RepID=UPI001F169D72|nr:formimidoylglutamase [Confluentibacter sediminis]
MKVDLYHQMNVTYQSGQKTHWSGRASHPDLGILYWHQKIALFHINELNEDNKIDIALLGYVCDEGVKRNQGRIGAAQGPKVLRERLGKLAVHDNKHIADIGDVICVENDMESCQGALSKTVSQLLSQNIFPIVIGGGHDMAYGHFMGIWDAVKNTSKKRIGIINFDAHFDLRPIETLPNSGTPFNQIISELENVNETVDYFAIGIQQPSNTNQLFNIAESKHVNYMVNYDCDESIESIKKLQDRLKPFIEKNDHIYITIDLDGFSSAYTPGVSAPSPLGFSPFFLFKLLPFLFETNKVIACDIAELNPTFDIDNRTSSLAAILVDFIVRLK